MMFGQGTSGWCPWCGAGYSTTDTILLFLFGLLVVAGVAILIIWLIRSASHGTGQGSAAPPSGAAHDTSVRIARERLARGEITKDEFDELMRSLGN